VLTDVALSAGAGVELYDVQPGSLPDLFAGDEMVVFGRYRGVESGEWSVSVRGRRNGRQEEFSTAVRDRATGDARYIEQLWAARKAGALSREIRLRGQTRELMDALKQLALRYGILTEYTSYLVQEPTVALRRAAETRQLHAPAAAPADQAGAQSVGRATQERSMRDAVRLEEVVVTANGVTGFDGARAHSGINPTQRIGGRLFTMRDSTWTDLGHGDSLHVVSIAPYSDAYFALLKALPDLREAASLEPAVLVAGRRVSIKIGVGGKTQWNPGELERLVREFRG
jgi:Ca-activated chloride channel family protein